MGWRDGLTSFNVLRKAGVTAPQRPARMLHAGSAFRHWGLSYAAGFSAAAARYPDRACVIDEHGTHTWADLDGRTNALARGLAELGVHDGDLVAVMCRNHRGFIEATAALAKVGASTLFMNTSFAGPQLREVIEREGPAAVIYDEEFAELLGADAGVMKQRIVAWHDGSTPERTLDQLREGQSTEAPEPPSKPGRFVILTSGTTGTPKGASRQGVTSMGPAIAMLERIPYRAGDVMSVPAPLFHSWGFGNLSIGLLLGATYVLRRRFDPEQTLADIERHRVRVLAVVPVMLQRILELPDSVLHRYDCSSLEVVPLSGSALPAGVAERWMDAFGENIYNLYGSTEVGWATIATPVDLRAAPGTAGTPPLHTVVKVIGTDDREVPTGEVGRIFVGSELAFEGYTGGGSKQIVDGLMSTGDTGRLDVQGRLFVVGRDDEMIVSGGENVYPREVEDLIASHPEVEEVAVVGVDDEEFGQRLQAFVVRRSGAAVEADEIKELVKDNLARFKVPREVVFLDELPRNATGKVLKKSLLEP